MNTLEKSVLKYLQEAIPVAFIGANISFEQLRDSLNLSNEELDTALISLEKEHYIIELAMANSDRFLLKLTDAGRSAVLDVEE